MNNRFTTLRSVLAAVRNGEIGAYEPDGKRKAVPVCFDVYWKDEDGSPSLDDEVFVGAPSPLAEDVPDEDYDYALQPKAVKDRGWWLSYHGELIEDVVADALAKKPTASDVVLLRAVEFYMEKDTFLHLS
ncbi:MAG: hypothetical protein R3C18_04725 [Planctomycetaceae bacterium]